MVVSCARAVDYDNLVSRNHVAKRWGSNLRSSGGGFRLFCLRFRVEGLGSARLDWGR